MKAIVTGGAGMLGAHLSRRLLKEGWQVHVVDNLSSGYRHNVPSRATFQWMDLSDDDAMYQLPDDGFDAIFHLASHVGQELSFDQPVYDIKANILPTMSLLKWAMEHGNPQIVFASSVNVYGNVETFPVTEDHPIDLPSPYAVGKHASESLLRIYEKFGVKSTVLRLFNVYGPGQDLSNLMQGMASIYMAYVLRNEPIFVRGSLDRFRDLTYVTDVADAFCRCVNPNAHGKVYNVCSGRKTVVRDLIHLIIKSFGHDPAAYPIQHGEPTRQDQFGFYGDPFRFRDDLGWESTITLEEGIGRMAEWARQVASDRNAYRDLLSVA